MGGMTMASPSPSPMMSGMSEMPMPSSSPSSAPPSGPSPVLSGARSALLVRTGFGSPPPSLARPAELNGALASYDALRVAPSARLPARKPDVTYRLWLTGGMARYDWGINGQSFDMSRPGALRFLMAEGQRIRMIFANTTTMYHPMHIHGYTFQLGPAGPRKDTVIVRPGQQVACEFDAANPASG